MDQALTTLVTSAIAACSAYGISHLQEQQKAKALKAENAQKNRQFDLEYVRQIVDKELQSLRDERDRSHLEIIRLHERIAVLEAQSREQEKSRMAAIVRLQRENEELRKINDQMAIELRQLQASLKLRASK